SALLEAGVTLALHLASCAKEAHSQLETLLTALCAQQALSQTAQAAASARNVPLARTFSESGAKGCHNCDLNFALKRRIGMAHCDLCPNSGSTFGTDKCYRKIRMRCDPSFDECEKTIDNDVNTYGVTIHILHAPAGTQEYRGHWQYTLDQVANKKSANHSI
uniref:Ephrin_rec_like domain-containing protein n=1 Tax=Macrostomum lignano TaxID=282301 RepID=A0A1I8I147_9PLAT